jgi:four helix bundle protein
MSGQSELLKKRTMKLALDVCQLIKHLPLDEPGSTVRRQLARSATSLAFNYRASCRARSHAEFTSKIGLVAEESDETQAWLEFIQAAELLVGDELLRLIAESTEISKIMSASAGTARYNRRNANANLTEQTQKPIE